MTWFRENQDYIWHLMVQHFWLSVIPVVAGFVIAVPLGWLASQQRWIRSGVLSTGSILYSIPALPLLIIVPTLIGTSILDPINVTIALTLYSAALLVQSATDGFTQISKASIDAATAVGYTRWQRAIQIEFPLAGPVLLAGVRVVSVSAVSLATIGALVGVSNLGNLFTDGFERGFRTEIVIGVIMVVGLALVLDLLWVLLGRLLMPWQRRAAR